MGITFSLHKRTETTAFFDCREGLVFLLQSGLSAPNSKIIEIVTVIHILLMGSCNFNRWKIFSELHPDGEAWEF